MISDPSWYQPVPLVEPRGLWVGLLFLLILGFYFWAEKRWPGR